MFTGIVERKALIASIERAGEILRLRLEAAAETATDGDCNPWRDLEIGESIAVNGCCLTLVEGDGDGGEPLGFDVVEETLRRTTLGSFQVGEAVNLERSLSLGDRLGGHYVTGHVDSIGTVLSFERGESEAILTIEHDLDAPFLTVEKGSVSVDGVSLTVAGRSRSSFTVALVPHTLAVTTLGDLKKGDAVNLEMDHFGRWVGAWLVRDGEVESRGRDR